MNKLSIALCIFAAVFLLVVVAYYSFKNWRNEIKKNKELRQIINEQNENMKFLLKHAEELKQIEKDQKTTDQKIAEAKTDEEIIDIINAVIASNNDRVRDDFPE